MDICHRCGAQNPPGNEYCIYCGTYLNTSALRQQSMPAVHGTKRRGRRYVWLMVWSIFTLLLCPIPGIVALVYASGIKSARDEAEEKKNYDGALTWCIVGSAITLVFILVFIAVSYYARNFAYYV